ncbi:mitochondrial fission 1 protein isoform X2 [Bemisia tabaci]|uniref:mitochondrial fission 1 protein isoform X2 n=1 Tax=Bemisia tabaci TaxID=7038 RepID=UPI0008F9A1CF|nr:PREDICTED: mitochondrial fission 1 protein isoform X2 [Bemisia tabaci]
MTDTEDLLNETVLPEDLKKYEKVYHEQLHGGSVTRQAQFNYAWCLVRSKFPVDIRKGIILLEELFRSAADAEDERRDYLYYLALGNCRIKEFSAALQYTSAFLEIEPGNAQVKTLEEVIRKKMEKEGIKGIAIISGVVLALGSIVGLGMALSKK